MGLFRKIFGKGGGKVIGTIIGTIIGTALGDPTLGARIGVAVGSGADTVARNDQMRGNRQKAEKDLDSKQRAEQERLNAIRGRVRDQVQAARQELANNEEKLALHEQEQRLHIRQAQDRTAQQENALRHQMQVEREALAAARLAWQKIIRDKHDELDKQIDLVLAVADCCHSRRLESLPEYLNQLNLPILQLIASELLEICHADDIDIISWLINNKFKKILIKQQTQILFDALQSGNDKKALAAIESDADVNAVLVNKANYNGYHALHVAVHWGRTKLLQKLLAEGADIHVTNLAKQNVLFLTVWNCHLVGCREIIDFLFASYPQEMQKQVSAVSEDGTTSLHATVMNAHQDIHSAMQTATKLIRFGADLGHKDLRGRTAEMLALEFGQPELAKVIREQRQEQHNLPILAEPIREFVAEQTLIDDDLCMAVFNNDQKALEDAIQNGGNVRAIGRNPTFSGFPALLIAAHWGKLEALKILLQQGADIAVTNNHNQNLLYLTVWNCQTAECRKVLNYLLTTYPEQMRKQLQANNNDRQTPLHAICMNAYLDSKALQTIAVKLINFGVKYNQADKNGLTASQLAVEKKQVELAMVMDKSRRRKKNQEATVPFKKMPTTFFKRSPLSLVELCLNQLNTHPKLTECRKQILNENCFFPPNLLPFLKPIKQDKEEQHIKQLEVR